jgi:signal peptidase II
VRPAFYTFSSRTIWLTAWTIWLFDYTTKSWALNNYSSEPQPFIGKFLQFTLFKNPGAAFSLATGFSLAFALLAVVVVITIVKYASLITSRGWRICAGLLLGGVLGNLSDRIFREPGFFLGHVIDWIQIPHWPVFNIADMAISTAAFIAFLQTMRNVPPIKRVQ